MSTNTDKSEKLLDFLKMEIASKNTKILAKFYLRQNRLFGGRIQLLEIFDRLFWGVLVDERSDDHFDI